MLYILSGQDDFSINQSLEEIKRELGDQTALATNTTMLEGQKVTLEQLRAVCGTVPFLAEKRLVIIKGLLERFEPRGEYRRQNRSARVTKQPDEYKSFSAGIAGMPESTILVLIEGKITNNNPLFRDLTDKAVIKSFPLLRGAQLRQWIQSRVREEGGGISVQAVDSLEKLVGSNLWVMSSEINKLVSFTSGRHIETEDVKAVVSYAQEGNIFAMVDAIIEFKAELAEQLLERLLQEGAAPAQLLFMLSRQLHRIVRAMALSKQGKPKAEIQSKLGLADFAIRKTLEQASRYSLPRLREVYRQLLEADLSIKTGRYEGELALNILVAELCQRSKVKIY